jgi:hypothetical protein
MCEAADLSAVLGYHRALVPPARCEPVRPDLQAIAHHVTVEVRIQVRAAIVASPAVCMQSGDAFDIPTSRDSIDERKTIWGRVIPDIGH